MRYEIWKNVGGSRLSNLQAESRFPNKPDEVTMLKVFDAPKDRGDSYGSRISGFFRVFIYLFIYLFIFNSRRLCCWVVSYSLLYKRVSPA